MLSPTAKLQAKRVQIIDYNKIESCGFSPKLIKDF